jgi:hypothetical protein
MPSPPDRVDGVKGAGVNRVPLSGCTPLQPWISSSLSHPGGRPGCGWGRGLCYSARLIGVGGWAQRRNSRELASQTTRVAICGWMGGNPERGNPRRFVGRMGCNYVYPRR